MCFIYEIDIYLIIFNCLILMFLFILFSLLFVVFRKLLDLYCFVASNILYKSFKRLSKSRNSAWELKMLNLMLIMLISNRIRRKNKTLNLLILKLWLTTKTYRALSTSSISWRSLNLMLFEPIMCCLSYDIMLSSNSLKWARL